MSTISNLSRETQPGVPVRIAVITALILCIAGAFAPLIKAGWVYDDVNLVKPSPALRNITGLGQAVSTDLYSQAGARLEVSPYWRPLAMVSFWLDTRFGDAPLMLHIGNILLHALSAALLALVIMRLHGGRKGITAAVLAAAFWAFHPENVEPVAWISCRYDLLCGVMLLCLLTIPWRPGPLRAGLYGLIFLAGLLSKEGFGIMAVVILAMDFADRRPAKDAAMRWVAVAFALGIWIFLRAILGIRSLDLPPLESIFRILRNYLEALFTYSRRALIPPPLSISHPYTPGGIAGVLKVLAGVLIFAGLLTAAIWRRRLMVPAAIFLAGLFPMAGAMTMFHEMPERYFYLPSIGLALLMGELIMFVLSSRHRLARVILPALAGVVIIIGLVRVETRLPDWQSDHTLWTSAYEVNPQDPTANYNLALAAGRRKDWSNARRFIKVAARGNPDSGRISSAYAWVLLMTGDATGAARQAEHSTVLEPYQPDGWYYLAFARHKTGDHAGELAALEQLLKIAPGYPGAQEARDFAACEVSGRKDCLSSN